MKYEELTETKVVGRKWTGYGHFTDFETEIDVFQWLDITQHGLSVLDDTPRCSKFNDFEVTLTIKKLS